MSEFRIKLTADLDDSAARSKLQSLLNGDNKIKLSADASDVESELKQILSTMRQLESASKSINLGKGLSGGSKSTSKLLSEFKALTNQYNALQKQLSTETNVKSVGVLTKQIEQVGKSIDEAKNKINQFGSEADKAMMNAFSTTSGQKLEASLAKTFSSLETKAKTLGTSIQSAFNNPHMDMGALNQLESKMKNLQSSFKNFNMDNLSGSSLNKLSTEIAQIESKFKSLSASANQVKLENKLDLDCSKAISQLDKLREAYSSLGKDTSGIDNLSNEIKQLQSSIGSIELGTLQNKFNGFNNEIKNMKSSVGELKGVGGSIKTIFGEIGQSFSAVAIGNVIADGITSSIRAVKDEILEMDKAMTNLKKVSDTALDTAKVTDQAVQISKQTGMGVADTINSMAEASKVGFGKTTEMMSQVAKFSQMYAQIGDMDTTSATQGMTALMNAFKIDPLKEYVVNVGNAKQKTTELANAMDTLNYAD